MDFVGGRGVFYALSQPSFLFIHFRTMCFGFTYTAKLGCISSTYNIIALCPVHLVPSQMYLQKEDLNESSTLKHFTFSKLGLAMTWLMFIIYCIDIYRPL